jgi:hypothetical protein
VLLALAASSLDFFVKTKKSFTEARMTFDLSIDRLAFDFTAAPMPYDDPLPCAVALNVQHASILKSAL